MRSKRIAAFLCASAVVAVAAAETTESPQDVVKRQARELVDAVTNGQPAVWERYLDPNVRYTDENGTVNGKKQMLDGIRPLPEGVSGRIEIRDFDAAIQGDVAIATYVLDENEDYHGHKLHCQYRQTDTWRKTADGWRLIAAQVIALRTDPPAIALPAAVRAEYCGRYALTPEITYEIACKGDSLEGTRSGRKPEELRAEAPDVLFVPGDPRYRKVFLRGPDGRVTGFAERREAWDIVWTRLPEAGTR